MTSGVGSPVPISSRRLTRSGSRAASLSASGSDRLARARATPSATSAEVPAASIASRTGPADDAHRAPAPSSSTTVEHLAGRWRRSLVKKSRADSGVKARRASWGSGPSISTTTRSTGPSLTWRPTGPVAGRGESAEPRTCPSVGFSPMMETAPESRWGSHLSQSHRSTRSGATIRLQPDIGRAVQDHSLGDQADSDPHHAGPGSYHACTRAGFEPNRDGNQWDLRALLDHPCDLGRHRPHTTGLDGGLPAKPTETDGEDQEVVVDRACAPIATNDRRWPARRSRLGRGEPP